MITGQKKLIILIPTFNEEENIETVIKSLPKNLAGIGSIEYVVIDDGSTDKTKERALVAGARVVSHPENKGVGAALQTGIAEALSAHADYMVNIDADGQFDPSDISALLAPILEKKADISVGSRFSGRTRPLNMSAVKYFGNKAMNFLINKLIGKKYSDVSCGFRAYNAEALLNLNLFGGFTYTQETFMDLIFKGFAIKEVPVSVKYFPGRKSRVARSISRYAYGTLKIIIRTLTFHRPFRFLGYPGIFLLGVGFLFVLFLTAHWLIFESFTPYKAFGFIGGGLMIFGLLMLILALMADTIDKLKKIQEKTLYFEKKKFYGYK